MSLADGKLKSIRSQIKKGVAPPRERVRWFLLWFGAERRGWNVVRHIRSKLDHYGLTTIPNFEYPPIDGYISFANAGEQASDTNSATIVPDPTYRIGRLASASSPPVSVKPDSTLQQAVTLMLTNDFSQLPVMTTEREVKGVISWKTIGSRLRKRSDGRNLG